jgi:hypothetical protein
VGIAQADAGAEVQKITHVPVDERDVQVSVREASSQRSADRARRTGHERGLPLRGAEAPAIVRGGHATPPFDPAPSGVDHGPST